MLLAPKARRTVRQYQLLQDLAFALGGRPGARQAKKQGITVSRDTLIRLIRKTPLPLPTIPRVLGVDDWAKRRGVEYGTILVDLEKHCLVDLLADRKAQTLTTWLKEHPGVEIISRDRASAYADGARQGAPQATQVADRFHILMNLTDYLKQMFERKNACLLPPQAGSVSQELVDRAAQAPILPEQGPQNLEELVGQLVSPAQTQAQCLSRKSDERLQTQLEETQTELALLAPASRKEYHFQQIKLLNKAGLSQRLIARELKISRNTVKKYLAAEKLPRYTPGPARPSKLDLYKPYLEARWRQGVYKTLSLFMEIKERGYEGSWSLLQLYLVKYRQEHPVPRSTKAHYGRPSGSGKPKVLSSTGQKPKVRAMLSAREACFVLLKRTEDLSEQERNLLEHLRAFDSEIETAYQLTQEFVKMVRGLEGSKLEEWLAKVEQAVALSQLTELGSFARGIRKDQAAVLAGLTLTYSQGQTEGQVNRLKTIKKSMYGRCKFDLLRARVLHQEAA